MVAGVSRDFVPVVKEFRAAVRAANMGGGVGRGLEIRTVFTGLIALAVIVGTGVLLYNRIPVPSGWWGLVGGVGTFYFLDPKTLIASTLDNIRKESDTKGGDVG